MALLVSTIVMSVLVPPFSALADGVTEQPADVEERVADDGVVEEVVETSDAPEEDGISVASDVCPPTSVGDSAPEGSSKFSGNVFKNFNASQKFPNVEVEIFESSSWSNGSYTNVVCVTTNSDGYYELFVPSVWDSNELGASVYPPQGESFTTSFGQTVQFNSLSVALNPAEPVQNFSLGGTGCPTGQGVAIPTQTDPFDMIAIQGTLASQVVGAKIVIVANDDFGAVCAVSMGGPYSVSIPRYWAQQGFMNGGGALLTAKPLSGSEGSTGGVILFPSATTISAQNFSFGPADFTANITLNGGSTPVTQFASTICVLQSSSVPTNKWELPTRCTTGTPTSSASNAGGVIRGTITYENGANDLSPGYWQYILDGPSGRVRSEWLPFTGSVVDIDVSVTPPSDSGGSPGSSGGLDAPCSGSYVTLRGSVSTSAGQPYPTTVSLWLSNDPNIQPSLSPPRWISNFGWKTVTTSAQGSFEMCFDKSQLGWNPTVAQIVAHSADRGPNATLGDTGGQIFAMETVPVPGPSSLALNPIVMAPPTVKGTVTGSARVTVVQQDSNGERDVAAVLTDSSGNFALSLPVPTVTGKSFYLLARGFGNGGSSKAPYLEEFPGGPWTAAVGATVRDPNVSATILDPDGNPISDRYIDFRVTGSDGRRVGTTTDNGSTMVTYLPEGTWNVEARCWDPGCPYARTTGTITVTPGSPPVVSGSTLPNWQPGSGIDFTFRASTGAIKFRVMDTRPGSEVNYSATVSVRANRYSSGGNYSWSNEQPGALGDSFGWSPNPGQYKLSLISTVESSVFAETEVFVETDGTTITKLCSVTVSASTGRDSLSCDQNIEPDEDGVFEFAIQVANFTAQVCAPATEGNPCPPAAHPTNTWAKPMLDVDRIVIEGTNVQQNRFTGVEITGTTAKLRIDPTTSAGIYRLRFSPPWGNPYLWATVEDLVYVGSDGKWWKCTNPENPLACTPPEGRTVFAGYDATTGILQYPQVRFEVSPIIGTVLDPSGNPVRDTWVEIQREITDDWGNTYFQWIGGAPTNNLGKFGFSVRAGKYRVRANPPWSNPSGFADGAVEFEVTVSSGVTAILTEPPAEGAPANGIVLVEGEKQLSVSLRNPNVTGRIKAGEQIREFAGLSVEKWVTTSAESGEWRWMPTWASTDESGVFRIFLEDGRWRLTAWPRGSDARDYVEGRVVVDVTSSALAAIDGVACGSGSPSLDCELFDLAYGVPNVAGLVRNSAGSPVPFVGVSIEKWSGSFGRYEWTNWSNGTSDGRYSVNLGDGLYRFGFNPPRTETSVVRTNRYVLVDDEAVCMFVSEVDAKVALAASSDGCQSDGAAPPTEQGLVVTMNAPNVQGRVTNNSGGGQQSWVRAEVWNGGYFEWQDQWAEANSSGSFSFDLRTSYGSDSFAIHRLTAEPRAGSGLSQGVSYVSVSASGVELWCLDETGAPADSCPPVPLVDGRVPVVLPGANLIAEVKFGSSTVNRGWVEVFKVDGGSLIWKTSTGLDNSGRFSLRLEADGNDLWTQYRVIVNPDPWSNPFNLSKKRIDLWVGDDDDPDLIRDEICLSGSGFTAGVAAATCDSWLSTSAEDPFPVGMSTGNVTGWVTRPECVSNCGVNQADLSVERWVTTSASSGYWQWTNNWARSGSGGAYSLQIDEAGDYRVTARPPWGSASYSPSSVEFTWTEASVSASNYTMEQYITLSVPNVSVIVQHDGQPVANAWVSVEKKVTNGQWTWWEWTGLGSGTTPQGQAAINITNTSGTNQEYRLVVYPPWNNSANLSRFTQLIKVKSDQTVVAWNGSGDLSASEGETTLSNLTFPTANLVLTVRDPNNASVRDAWVYVEKWVTTSASSGYWQWIDVAGGTSSNGRVALTLVDDGSYRVIVNPPWNRTSLPRFSREFTVSSGAFDWDSSVAGIQSLPEGILSFPDANVVGTVFVNSDGQRNTFSWVEVRNADGSQYVTGTHTDANGAYSLSLPAGTYSVWFYGNSSSTTAPPTNVIATVSATAITSWAYSNGGGGCPDSGTCTLDPVLERVPPNLEIHVTLNGVSRRGAFVRLTDSSGARFDFVSNAQGRVLTHLTPGNVTVSVLYIDTDGTVLTGSANLTESNFGGSPLTPVVIPISSVGT